MEKQAQNHKHKKKPSQPKRKGLKQKALKWKKNPQIKKPKKKISYPKPDGLRPKAIKQ